MNRLFTDHHFYKYNFVAASIARAISTILWILLLLIPLIQVTVHVYVYTCMAFLLHILLSQTQSLKTIYTYVWMTADNTQHDCTFITASNERVYTCHVCM